LNLIIGESEMTVIDAPRFKIYVVLGFMIFFAPKIFAKTTDNNFDPNWYVGGNLGTHFSSNGDTYIPSIFSKPPLKSEPMYRSGISTNLNLGYTFLRSFRIEGEIGYQNLPMYKINDAIGAGTVIYAKNSNTNLFSTFINAYYNFNGFNRLIPYIGLGSGYVNVQNIIKPNPPIPVSPNVFFQKKILTYDTWGYQGILGAMYQLKQNICLGLNYRYFATFKQEKTGHTNIGPDGYKTKQEITTNIVSIAIQYAF
jgi:opacity protein-like surface antigen